MPRGNTYSVFLDAARDAQLIAYMEANELNAPEVLRRGFDRLIAEADIREIKAASRSN